VRKALQAGDSPLTLEGEWKRTLKEFEALRRKYLHYR
jgi:hypothetical protein